MHMTISVAYCPNNGNEKDFIVLDQETGSEVLTSVDWEDVMQVAWCFKK